MLGEQYEGSISEMMQQQNVSSQIGEKLIIIKSPCKISSLISGVRIETDGVTNSQI